MKMGTDYTFTVGRSSIRIVPENQSAQTRAKTWATSTSSRVLAWVKISEVLSETPILGRDLIKANWICRDRVRWSSTYKLSATKTRKDLSEMSTDRHGGTGGLRDSNGVGHRRMKRPDWTGLRRKLHHEGKFWQRTSWPYSLIHIFELVSQNKTKSIFYVSEYALLSMTIEDSAKNPYRYSPRQGRQKLEGTRENTRQIWLTQLLRTSEIKWYIRNKYIFINVFWFG